MSEKLYKCVIAGSPDFIGDDHVCTQHEEYILDEDAMRKVRLAEAVCLWISNDVEEWESAASGWEDEGDEEQAQICRAIAAALHTIEEANSD